MTKRGKDEISRRKFLGVTIGAAVVAGIGCGSEGGGGSSEAGGTPGTGGSAAGNGGSANAGGAPSNNGTVAGGATSNGGNTSGSPVTGGATSTTGGNASTGGDSASGGTTAANGTGGTSNGGTTANGTGGSSVGTTPIVAMVRDADVATATMTAIAKIGLPDLAGKVVVIRPNQIEGNADGTTNPEVIRGVIKAIKAASSGAVKQIIVAEDGFSNGGGHTLEFMEQNKVAAVCTAEGATAVELNGTATTNYKPAAATAWGGATGAGIDFYNTVYTADYVINVPRCKTHGSTNFSMALKAWFGSIKRPSSLHSGNLHNKCAETHLVRKEDFVVLDASRCMVTGGPTAGGTMMDSKIVVASKDAIAADITGIAIIRYFGGTTAAPAIRNTLPWDQPQIKRALALAIPGWLSSAQDFPYWASTTITEAAAIMAKRIG